MPEQRQHFGLSALVKALQADDINGAPLLFQAASSRSKGTCFQAVRDTVRAVSAPGLVEQVVAKDLRGRNIMMHYARGKHAQVFEEVEKMCWRFSPDEWRYRALPDHTGRTLLHHAAEVGSLAVFEQVLKMTGVEIKAMDGEDANGRTPLMHFLRHRHGPCEGESRDELKTEFNTLYARLAGAAPVDTHDWMKRRFVLHLNEAPKGVTAQARTELLHAARGGYESLRLVIGKIGEGEPLDEILGVMTPPGTEPLPSFLNKDLGRGMLIASAAKGGDLKVLKAVVRAIKVRLGRVCSPSGNMHVRITDWSAILMLVWTVLVKLCFVRSMLHSGRRGSSTCPCTPDTMTRRGTRRKAKVAEQTKVGCGKRKNAKMA